MKAIFSILILTLCVAGFVSTADAQAKQKQEIKMLVGTKKKASRSKLTVQFVSVIEDSRCPEDVNCVWAGNAKIKISVKSADKPEEFFELNTNTGAKGATYGRYAVYLTELTPISNGDPKTSRIAYTAKFSISRLSR